MSDSSDDMEFHSGQCNMYPMICNDCGIEFDGDGGGACPDCYSINVDLIDGPEVLQ